MGRTGSGKTTLLEVICGLLKPTSGRVELMGADLTHAKPAQRNIGYIPQDGALFTHMTVGEQLGFSLRIRHWSKEAIAEWVAELAELLHITHIVHRKPKGLSGGEIQRVALGRALAFRPSVVCLDEPLSALDHDTRVSICNLLREIKEKTGVTFLHITHDISEAERLADLILEMEDGSIVSKPS